jgi:anthranilate phosphoribosyltransferase
MIEARPAGHDFAKWIHEIGRGPHAARPLAPDAACELGSAMLAGEVPPLELGAILLAYRVKGETVGELTGFMAAIDRQLARLAPPAGANVRPVVLPTYNGARKLPNLTPLLALLLRRYGVPVLLHGMADEAHDFGRVTTAAVLWELGIEPAESLAQAQQQLGREGIAYVPTPLLSPALASLIDLRRRMGVRSIAHTLAKLSDPFNGAGLRVVAVTHPDYVTRMGEFLLATRANALLLRGTEGEPFANPRRQPRIEGFEDGMATVLVDAEPSASTMTPALPEAIDAVTTAAWIGAALAGEVPIPQPIVNQVACCMKRPVSEV